MSKIKHDARYIHEALGVDKKQLAEKLKAVEEKAKALPKGRRNRISEYLAIMDDTLTKRELLFMMHVDMFRPQSAECLMDLMVEGLMAKMDKKEKGLAGYV